MQLHVYPTPGEVIQQLAAFFIDTVNLSINENGRASVVLSGGNSPKQLFELLAAAYYDKTNWQLVDFFFGDERYVAFEDSANNGHMAANALFIPLKVPAQNIHYINTSLSPVDASADYTLQIERYFNGRPIRFDLNLLGLGDNVHTASLFPNTAVLFEMKALVKAIFIDEINAWRITMTAPVINESKQIVFLVFGESKAKAVYQVLKGERNINAYPAQLIEPEDGELHWFIDAAAAGTL